MGFLMWVAHTLDGRPLTRISDVTTERKDNRTIVRAKITGGAKIKGAMLWVGYTDNPQWRDVMWYHYHMWDRGDHWEGSIHGKVPDGIIVEVSDIAQGIPGYVSTTPRQLTDAPVVERDPEFGWLPRYWKPSE